MTCRRFVITGRVQGVGYRWFVKRTADELGLSGEVWNRPDGAVEAQIWSLDPQALDAFERRLPTGPGSPQQISATPIHEPADGIYGMSIR